MIEPLTLHRARGQFALRRALPPAPPTDAPTVLCLHGFPDTAATFDPLLTTLADAGFVAVAPTLRGYRPSTLAGPFDLDTLADDAADLAAALSPERPVDLVGHDWGAAIAVAAAQRHPRRVGAVVTLAVPHPLAFLRALLRSGLQRRQSGYMAFFQLPALPERALRDTDLVGALWGRWSPGWTPPAALVDAARESVRSSLPGPLGPYRAMLRPVRGAVGRIVRGDAPVHAPTLHVYGDRDGCIAAASHRDNARYFAGAYAALRVEGVGHWPHREAQDMVEAAVRDWLLGRGAG